MATRHFYAAEFEYPANGRRKLSGFTRVTVHRYDSIVNRDNRVAYERFRHLLDCRWRRLPASHPLIRQAVAKAQAGHEWPVTIIPDPIEEPE